MTAPTTARSSKPGRPDVWRGMLCMLVAVAMFSGINALVKWLSPSYPVQQILAFRAVLALIPCVLLLRRGGGVLSLGTTRPADHVVRGLLGVSALALLFVSLEFMPLTDATVLYFSAPLFVVVLSRPLLGEAVTLDRGIAAVLGFLGVAVVLAPGTGAFEISALVPLAAGLLLALSLIMSRRLSATEDSAVIAFYFSLLSAAVVLPFAPFGWVTPPLLDAAALCSIGLAGGLGIYLLTQAYRFAAASIVAPFDYLSVLWAALFGYWFWSEVPSWRTAAGAALIVGSGAYAVRRGAAPPETAANSPGRAPPS